MRYLTQYHASALPMHPPPAPPPPSSPTAVGATKTAEEEAEPTEKKSEEVGHHNEGEEDDEAAAAAAAAAAALEMYQWDCCGHLILRNVMPPAWLAAANTALDHHEETQDSLPMGGLLGLEPPHADPFARMLDHPAIVSRLNWIMGPGWVIEGPTGPMNAVQGESTALEIHSGGAPVTPISLVRVRHGRSYTEVVKVAWQLRDVNLAALRNDGGDDDGGAGYDGGYICIPGSHRARRQLPFTEGSFEKADAMAPSNAALREAGHLQLLRMRAGDVCLFMAASQTHGAAAWQGKIPRRCVIYGVWSRSRAPPWGSRTEAMRLLDLEEQRPRL